MVKTEPREAELRTMTGAGSKFGQTPFQKEERNKVLFQHSIESRTSCPQTLGARRRGGWGPESPVFSRQ